MRTCKHAHASIYSTCGTCIPKGRRQAPKLPWYQVAGLSDTMVRSCHGARPERAEQWSRSADGAAEGTTSRSVSLAVLRWSTPDSDPLLAHTMEGGRSRAQGNGGEFPACHNKMESSILVTVGMGQTQLSYTQNTSLLSTITVKSYQWVNMQLEIIHLWVSGLSSLLLHKIK